MKIFSFENGERNQDGFYDLFKKTVINKVGLIYDIMKISRDIEYRPDLLSKALYGSDQYIEETMVMNNILNPFALKIGTSIYKAYNTSNLLSMYQKDNDENTKNKDKILNINKSKTSKSTNYPPSVKPDNLNQMNINYNKKKITLINKFK